VNVQVHAQCSTIGGVWDLLFLTLFIELGEPCRQFSYLFSCQLVLLDGLRCSPIKLDIVLDAMIASGYVNTVRQNR